uniref:Hsp20/alpha crystallin family protein n=1 Tax=Flavobacterium sp. TaxID=239 RepID=UPI004049B383
MKTIKKNYGFTFPALMDELLKPEFAGMQHLGMKIPAVNIKKIENGYELELAAPGLKKEDFNLELNEDTLTIFVENKKNESEETTEYTRREFQYGAFKRTFTLPETVNEDEIKASYENGVLHIQLPNKEATLSKSKRLIEIA